MTLTRKYRLDAGSLVRKDAYDVRDDGSVIVDASVTRVGVFEYVDPRTGKVTRELRPPEEVLDPASLKTLSLIPFTNDHPPEMVTLDNIRNYQKGTTGENVEVTDDHVYVKVAIQDQETISLANNGKTQVSSGYFADVEETPGTWNGEPYDFVQRNIRYNHVALVDTGRAGPSVSLRMDSEDSPRFDFAIQVETNEMKVKRTDEEMPAGETVSVEIGGITLEVAKEVAVAIALLKEKAGMSSAPAETPVVEEANPEDEEKPDPAMDAEDDESSEEEKKTDSADMVKLLARVDALEAENKKLRSAKNDKATEKRVRARIDLEQTAKKLFDAEDETAPKFDGLSDAEIKAQTLKTIVPGMSLKIDTLDLKKERDRIYVDSLWDVTLEQRSDHNDLSHDLAEAVEKVRSSESRKTKKDSAWDSGPPKLRVSVR